ncbi:hypothetical protein GMDG_08354 [Pseudogymnoascus destructans 20631-21]|uniref:Amino acid permease/ SLC12A domain-containing protein n=1 Tax=Pseudogymnoascus destructans (strain ATCC MYA-4855 / 20631-21) TaxID=658429 RepID=L8G3P4_PSED2|nr:hypothetical protein GMDG_08354 [Pseudogymnoascus destructans 20631-21]
MAPGNDHPPTNRPTFQTRTAVDVAGELNSRFSVFVDDSTPSQETQFGGDKPSGSNEALSSGTSKGGSILSSPFNFTKRVLNIHTGSSSTETTPLLRKRTTTNGQKSQTSPTRAGPHADQRNPDGDDKRTKPGLGPRPVGGSDKLGTFSGVFVPTCLNVLSILMFLRFGFILGQAGVLGIMGMLVAAYSIDLITIFSLSAIASNGTVRGGGAYYLISRSLGPEFGGAIGLVFYMGQVFNTGLNAVALVDAIQNNIGAATGDWARILPESQGYNYLWATVVLLVCTGTCLAGSGVFARASNGLLIILLISTMSIPFSALVMAPFESRQLGIQFTGVSLDTFKGNLFPRFTKGAAGSQSKGRESFQGLFGILFPATSGIFAGASMSGDLKHPSKAIPKGTLWALALTFVLYTLVILSLACTVTRASFVADINIIQDTNVSAALVLAGEFATTFFSTLMGVIGCAKLMQALARDELYPGLSIFGQGTKKADEPVYAICFTYLAAQIVMLFDINQIASLITMAYLMTFLVMNLATFLLKIGSAPNFRPSFHFFSWQTAFLGAVFSGTAMIFVDGVYASVCVAILIVLFLLVHYTSRPRSWGDVSQSLIYHQVRKYLLRLKPEHVKFWRPQILLFVNDPRRQYKLIQFCNSMKKGSLYILGHVVVSDDFGRTVPEARRQQVAWSKYIEFSNVKAFVNIAISPTLEWGVRNLSLSAGLGGMRPNIAVIGFYNMDDLNKSKSTTLSSPTDAAGTQTPSDGYDQEAPKDGPSDDTSGLKLAAQLPTDSCQTESTTSIMSYVTVLEDLLLRLQINVAVARGFNGLEIPNPKGHNKKNILISGLSRYTLILQLGCILNTVPSWKKSYKLRVAVFVEYETDVEEERIRVKSLLENLRIQAEVKVFWLASGSLPTYEIIVNGNSSGPEAEAEVEECLKDQEWWEEMQKIRGKRGQPLASGLGLNVENLLGSSAWPDASFQQGPRHEKVERFLGLRNLLHKSKRRRTMSGFSKLGVNLGMRAQRLPAQLTHRASSERDYSDSESSSDDSDEDNDDDQSIASEADADDRKLDSDGDLRSSTKLVRRKSHGDAMQGPRSARNLVAPKELTLKNKSKSNTASNTTTPARSLKDFDTSGGAPSLKESQDANTAPTTSSNMEPPPRKLEERFSALRQSPSKSQLSPTKPSHASGARERPILSRHASSQKFSSKPVPVSQVASQDGAGPSIMFIDTPSPSTKHSRLQSAYCSSQDNNDNGGTSSNNPSSSPPKSLGSTYSTQSLPLSFNDLPCRAQHLILNELMRQNSKDTAVMFTTLPSPSPGTHQDEEACIAYISDLQVLGRGCPPCLMVHSNSMTVTMSL